MNLREFLRFSYGLFMGTSTPYLKPKERFLFPTKLQAVDESLSLLLGGSGVCGVLSAKGETLVINTNRGAAARELRTIVDEAGGRGAETVVLTSVDADFSGGLEQFADARQIFVAAQTGAAPSKRLTALFRDLAGRAELLSETRVIEVAGERVHLIPVAPAATDTDLAVFLEHRSILFAGPLFFHRIHPILRVHAGMRAREWGGKLEKLLDQYKPKWVVPAEGDMATAKEARQFVAYLRDLLDDNVEFSTCRQRYDWMEIPSQTSLEENFDFLRDKVKTHTTIN